jgi:hypothetical protein
MRSPGIFIKNKAYKTYFQKSIRTFNCQFAYCCYLQNVISPGLSRIFSSKWRVPFQDLERTIDGTSLQ